MKIQLSSGTYQTIMYGIGLVIMKAVSLIMIPYVTRFLDPEQFGTLEIVLTFLNLSSIVMGLGLCEALFRFAGQEKDTQKQNIICASVSGLTLILSAIAASVLIVLAPMISQCLPGEITSFQVRIVLVALVLDNFIAIQLGWLRLSNAVKLFVMLTTARALLQAVFVLITLAIGWGVNGVLISSLASTGLLFLFLFIYQYNKTGIQFNWQWSKRFIIYGAPLAVSGIGAFALLGLDQWWLASSVGVSEMAQYALAMKFAIITAFVMDPFSMWWEPRRFTLLKEADGIAANARIASMGAVMGLLAALFIGLGSIAAIRILTPETYHQAIYYVPWLALMWGIKNVGNLLSLGCYVQHSTHYAMIIELASSAIAVLGYYYFIARYGIAGAIIALAIAYSFRLVCFYIVSQRILYLPYPKIRLCAITCLILLALYMGTVVQSLWLQLLLPFALLGVVSLIAMAIGMLPKPTQLMRISKCN